MKHTVFSLIKDIKAFGNITKIREKHFAAAPSAPIKAPQGMNALAKELHPESVTLTVTKKTIQPDGAITLSLRGANGVLPYFRAGQYINMLCGENIYPFFLSGAPADASKGLWKITAEAVTSPSAFAFVSALKEGDTLTAGAPMGYFYYQPLRDGVTSAVITDLTGKGAALSMQNNENTEVFFCEKPEDIPVAQSVKADTVFICGKKEFCEKAKAAFTGRHMRVLFTDPPIVRTERGKFTCTVCCGDDTFSFDCFSDEPLMTALEKNGVRLFNKCRTGDCAFCRAKLISGTVSHAFDGEDDARRKADVKFGYIHPCRAFPESDVTLKY